ncbi:methyl-accepting chemotaxis protein [Conexibacter sp. SYSU D00693]|uniref:methyl-accepting chemotaxis protein n=1 Tax=Conexibacter sp. SYSU D00693 TaxID=2812560 RepID=UPI00196B1563|nr:cache domain-containing protein [Conexibacter sp. SYSU D00693]
MPQRVVQLATEVSGLATEKLQAIEDVADRTQMLAINARIQAAHAGDRGAAFAVVAEEVGDVARHVRELSSGLTEELTPRVEEIDALGRHLVEQVPGQRAADLALNAVELIDRNLYERSCDVRWWATDSAMVDACADPQDAVRAQHASRRLGVILAAYTVYVDLWVADRDGTVIAHGRPDRHPGVAGSSVADASWFQRAMATPDGDAYVVDDITRLPALADAPVATYATAVRAGGESRGEPIGALGIFFDWGPQAQGIVEGLRLSDEERERTRAMLVDADGLVLAASDGQGILEERFRIATDGRESGFYGERDRIVGFAHTPGYETYAGLGWYGVLVQRRKDVA